MSEKEKKIMETIAKAVKGASEPAKDYLLGWAEGAAFLRPLSGEKPSELQIKAWQAQQEKPSIRAQLKAANEAVCGLGYEDLHQEGCLALCRAAATYDGVSAQFSTYATTLIRNHLTDCCKAVSARLRNLPAIPLDIGPPDEERPPGIPELSVGDGVDALIDRLDADALLSDCYQGRKGTCCPARRSRSHTSSGGRSL